MTTTKDLWGQISDLEAMVREWKARAEKAERQVRSLIHAAEVWKNRTISAEAALKGWEQSR